MNITSLLEILKWAGVAAGLLAASGVTVAAILAGLRQILAVLKVTLTGQVTGVLASVLTVLVTGWTLFTAQGCPWWIALLASVIAVFAPHAAYNGYQATRLAATAPAKTAKPAKKG